MSKPETIFSKAKLFQLLMGTIGIYVSYLVVGLMQQRIIKYSYINNQKEEENFNFPIYMLLIPNFISYVVGKTYNYFTIAQQTKTVIPNKNSAICAFLSLAGGLTFNYAIKMTNYPIVVTVKSCNLLSVVIVGTLCSRVSDAKLKLSTQKIFIGIIATFGIVIFKYFDPQQATDDSKSSQILGFLVLFMSVLTDGFLPDFQAQIKQKYHPQPTQMMSQVNKWVCIIALIYIVIMNELTTPIKFILQHESIGWHLLVLGVLSCSGQLFVYRMIREFKQHIVPFVITTRKIFTVGISILFYGHRTSAGQILGMLLVFAVVIYQFLSEILLKKAQPTKSAKNNDLAQIQQTQFISPTNQDQQS